ncbi:glycoside hydrolase family 32 protein [Weissella uvarum]|nr:glycoside hydrolase family 32 protein [Weissella uvarum]
MTLVLNDSTQKQYEQYHLYPERGLLNDPNGLVYFKGKYHVFYQWNPNECDHSQKYWGHFISDDLKHWVRLDAALAPSEMEDAGGVYSGSAFVKDEKLYLFYTGNRRDENGKSIASTQMLAASEDGIDFKKLGSIFDHPTGYTKDVRDPMVWQGKNGHYYLILGARPNNNIGDIIIYESTDFLKWRFRGSLIEGELQNVRGYMLECPNLIKVDGKDVLIFSPQGLAADQANHRYENIYNTGYVVGKFNEETAHFEAETNFKELDQGFEFYAPQTMQLENGRQIMWGWAGIMPPEREQTLPTIESKNWAHVLTVPRELHIIDDELIQTAIPEILEVKEIKNVTDMQSLGVGQYLINTQDNWKLHFGMDMTLERLGQSLILSRRQWDNNIVEERVAIGQHDNILMIVDHDIIEVFTDDGKQVMTARYF